MANLPEPTTADFVAETSKMGCGVVGLPEGVTPSEAAARFAAAAIPLERVEIEQCWSTTYGFCHGWFPKVIRGTNGKDLFIVEWKQITLMPAAQEILKQLPPTIEK